MTTTILVILGILLVGVIAMMFRNPAKGAAVLAPASPQSQLPNVEDVKPWDARRGDVISIHGAAEDFSDLDFTVDRRSGYESNNHSWIDVSGEFRGRRVYLELYGRTNPEAMGILDAQKLTLPDLNTSEQQLADMDSRQDSNAALTYDGKRWFFESSREIGYRENETNDSEGLYRWLFREQNGNRLLCVEKWEGEPFDVRIARRLNIQDITVYRAA